MGEGWREAIVSNSKIYTEYGSIVQRHEGWGGWCMNVWGNALVRLPWAQRGTSPSDSLRIHTIVCFLCFSPPRLLCFCSEFWCIFNFSGYHGNTVFVSWERQVHGREPRWQSLKCVQMLHQLHPEARSLHRYSHSEGVVLPANKLHRIIFQVQSYL